MGQVNVINALVLRETRTRFGQHQLGYAWALVEPALMILTFLGMFAVVGRKPASDMDSFGYLATGILPYLLFTKTTVQVSQAINGNKGLLFYPQVKPLDVVLARIVLEFCTYAVVFLLLMGANVFIRRDLSISDPLLIVAGFALASLLGASLGLIFMGLGQLSNVTDRARGPLMRPFFWVSGLFFTVDSLPQAYRELIVYNPVIHLVELVRAGWFTSYDDTYTNIPYALMWVLGMTLIGLTLETVTRRKIEVT
jgi:capsular polysaccharide transport system permease protein